MVEQVKTALRSRTVWTGVVIFIINGFPAVRDLIPTGGLPFIDAILLFLTAYFRVNARA